MLQSAVSNAPYYDRLFRSLHDKGISHDQCHLLQPMKQVHDWLLDDDQLLDEIDKVFADMANGCKDISYPKPSLGELPTSQSSDSGFHSKPPTPGYGSEDLTAGQGRFASIPGIEDMNMYPSCAGMPEQFQQLRLHGDEASGKSECSLSHYLNNANNPSFHLLQIPLALFCAPTATNRSPWAKLPLRQIVQERR